MPTDWVGLGIAVLIILTLIIIIIAKVQGDRVVDVLGQIFELAKGDK